MEKGGTLLVAVKMLPGHSFPVMVAVGVSIHWLHEAVVPARKTVRIMKSEPIFTNGGFGWKKDDSRGGLNVA
jgi:hypothetical protein